MTRESVLLVGALLVGLACLMVGTAPRYSNFSLWLRDWQTLIAGLVALGAALATIEWMQKQIEETQWQADDRRRRELDAARAVLPLALSEISSYESAVARTLKFLLDRALASGPAEDIFAPVELPDDFTVPTLPKGCDWRLQHVRQLP